MAVGHPGVVSALVEVECLRTLDRLRVVEDLEDAEIASRREAMLQQRLKFAQSFHDHVGRRGAFLDCLSSFPIQALDLIRQHHAPVVWFVNYDDFEGIPLLVVGHGAAEHQAACTIVGGW
jgi:hypothetical protein